MHGGYRLSVRTPVIRKDPQSFVLRLQLQGAGEVRSVRPRRLLRDANPSSPVCGTAVYRCSNATLPAMRTTMRIAVLVGRHHRRTCASGTAMTSRSRVWPTAGGGAHEITIGYELVQRHKKRAAHEAAYRALREVLNASTDLSDGTLNSVLGDVGDPPLVRRTHPSSLRPVSSVSRALSCSR